MGVWSRRRLETREDWSRGRLQARVPHLKHSLAACSRGEKAKVSGVFLSTSRVLGLTINCKCQPKQTGLVYVLIKVLKYLIRESGLLRAKV